MENKVNADEIIAKINAILNKTLPGFKHEVTKRKNFIGSGEYLAIWAAASDHNINNVKGQKVQVVSLSLDLTTLELHPQVFGGNGGQSIYRKPNMDDAKEKYLAMKSVKIPFRTPPKEEGAVLKAIEKFFQNYKKALIENKDQLMYQDIVNYDELLGGSKMEKGGVLLKSKPYLPSCNLILIGKDRDINGNSTVKVSFPNGRAFSIQTNGVLPETQYILQRAHKEISEDELEVIGEEVAGYVSKYGSRDQKAKLKTYGSKMAEGGQLPKRIIGDLKYFAKNANEAGYETPAIDKVTSGGTDYREAYEEYRELAGKPKTLKFDYEIGAKLTTLIKDNKMAKGGGVYSVSDERKENQGHGSILLVKDTKKEAIDYVKDKPDLVYTKFEDKWAIKKMAKGGSVSSEVQELVNGYKDALLFAEVDYDTEESFDSKYDRNDFAPETNKKIEEMCSKYYAKHKKDIEESGMELSTVGNDIYYTQAGHGAGFFDHGLDKDVEKRLTDGAEEFGDMIDVEAGDDGKIRIRGGRKGFFGDGGNIMAKGGSTSTGKIKAAAKDIQSINHYIDFSVRGNSHEVDYDKAAPILNDSYYHLNDKELFDKYGDVIGTHPDADEFDEETGRMEEFRISDHYAITFKDDSTLTLDFAWPDPADAEVYVDSDDSDKMAGRWESEFNKSAWDIDISELESKINGNKMGKGGNVESKIATLEKMLKSRTASEELKRLVQKTIDKLKSQKAEGGYADADWDGGDGNESIPGDDFYGEGGAVKGAERNKLIYKYVIDAIDASDRDLDKLPETDAEKIKFLWDTFKSEYGWAIKRMGPQKAFCEWEQGLPSAFNIDYENYRIIEIGKEWGILKQDATEKQEDKFIETWWARIFMGVRAAARKNKVELSTAGEFARGGNVELDNDAQREIQLYIENDGDLYRQQIQPIYKNLITKAAQGKYNKELSAKLFQYLVENGDKKYQKEFGEKAGGGYILSVPDRKALAKTLADEFFDIAKTGEYDEYIPAKYKKTGIDWSKYEVEKKAKGGHADSRLGSASSVCSEINDNYSGAHATVGKDGRISVTSKFFNDLSDIKRKYFNNNAIQQKNEKGEYVMISNEVFSYGKGGQLPEKGSPDWHQLQIAKKTIKMNPVMANMMGGMSIDEAKKILDKYSVKYGKGGLLDDEVFKETHGNADYIVGETEGGYAFYIRPHGYAIKTISTHKTKELAIKKAKAKIKDNKSMGSGGKVGAGDQVNITDNKSLYKGKSGYIVGESGKKSWTVKVLVDGKETNCVVSKKGVKVIN